MGFFKKIFKRKPGGTFVGKLIRGVGDNFTGGLVSAIAPVPEASQFNEAGDFNRKGDAKDAVQRAMTVIKGGNQQTPPANGGNTAAKTFKQYLTDWKVWVGVVVTGILGYFALRPKDNKRKRRR